MSRSIGMKGWGLAIVGTLGLLGLGGCVGAASPGSACATSVDSLAGLREGMSYQQVAQAIGCSGTIDRSGTVDGSQVTVARWSGPGASPFSATLVNFRNDRLVAVAVNGQ